MARGFISRRILAGYLDVRSLPHIALITQSVVEVSFYASYLLRPTIARMRTLSRSVFSWFSAQSPARQGFTFSVLGL